MRASLSTWCTLVLAAGLLPTASVAQTAAQRPAHLYLVASASLLTRLPFSKPLLGTYPPNRVGPALMVGYVLNDHQAVQTGAISYWYTDESSSSFTSNYGGPTLDYVTYSNQYRTTQLIVPLLVRYAFNPQARLHIDALLGGSWLYTGTHVTQSYTSAARPSTNSGSERDNSYHDAALTLGPELRYTLLPQLDLTANVLFNERLRGYGSFTDRLTNSYQIGGHYYFGW